MTDLFSKRIQDKENQNYIYETKHPEAILYCIYFIEDTLQQVLLTESHLYDTYKGLHFSIINDHLFVNGGKIEFGITQIDGIIFFVLPSSHLKTHFIRLNSGHFVINNEKKDSGIVSIDDSVIVIDVKNELTSIVMIKPGNNFLYYNQKKITSSMSMLFDIGDKVLTPDMMIERGRTQWKITTFSSKIVFHVQQFLEQSRTPLIPQDFPEYRRSPRLNLEVPDETIKLQKIEEKEEAPKGALLKTILPPLGMLLAGGVTTMLSGRNPLMMLATLLASGMTVIFTVTQFYTEKKDRINREKEREKDYQTYLLREISKAGELHRKEAEVLNYQQPSPEMLLDMIGSYDSRIYERLSNNKDFLQVSLGLTTQNSNLKISCDYTSRDEGDWAKHVKKLVEEFGRQKDVPLPIDLKTQTLGLIGTYDLLKNQIANLYLQLSFFHSYRDLNFITLVPEKSYLEDWNLWRFLPHIKVKGINTRGIVHHAKSRDLVLSNFYQLINSRKQALEEAGREKISFSPHFIFTIFDDSYLSGHNLNEFLAEDMSELGVTVIWCKEDKKQLPETPTALIEIKNRQAGILIQDKGIHLDKVFSPYPFINNQEIFETRLRKLTNLEHMEVEKNAIPERLSLLEQYMVPTVEELNVAERWKKAEPSKSIVSMIGWKGKEEPAFWDLHEQTHGPHAIVGGTSGSGKSEFLTTYLIGLAINFSPEDIGMLIIDWKGGGIADTLAELPHFMGSITNLDGAGTARALASINAELKKRQREFRRFGVQNISGYTKLYRERLTPRDGVRYPEKPLPHLMLVSDEFAELKENVPEFLDELTSVARIGRSLGVHLILATQKPDGVVNDQIDANAKSKIALKMSDETNSKALIKTGDAAHITNAGRGYLRVGESEVYELFQSGYGGVDYTPYDSKEEIRDERVYQINDSGQLEIFYDPTEEQVDQGGAKEELPTQLQATINEIIKTFEKSLYVQPDKPWLPSLGKVIVTEKVMLGEKRNLTVPFGLLDIPNLQKQKVYYYNLEETSHTVIFSSPGFGKSTALQTLIMNLSKQNTPSFVQFNLLDFGTNGLLPLKDLPHVADIVRLDESEKLEKVLNRIYNELENRKKDFQKSNVTDYKQYEKKEHLILPVIINVLDGYDALADDKRKDRIDILITQILREGASLGIYILLSANRSGAISTRMSSNIQTNIVLTMVDDMEARTILGEKGISIPEIPGRGQLILEGKITEIQIFLVVESSNNTEYVEQIISTAQKLSSDCMGERALGVPILPNPLTYQSIELSTASSQLILGYSKETTNPYFWDMDILPLLLVSLDTEEQGHYLIEFMLKQLKLKGKTMVLVDGTGDYQTYQEYFDQYISEDDLYSLRETLLGESENVLVEEKETLKPTFNLFDDDDEVEEMKDEVLTEAIEEVNVHQDLVETIHESPTSITNEDIIYYISDLESVITNLNLNNTDIKALMKQHDKKIIFVSFNSYLATSYDDAIKYLRSKNKIGMFGVTRSEQKQVPTMGYLGNEPFLEPNEFYAYHGRQYEKVLIPMEKKD